MVVSHNTVWNLHLFHSLYRRVCIIGSTETSTDCITFRLVVLVPSVGCSFSQRVRYMPTARTWNAHIIDRHEHGAARCGRRAILWVTCAEGKAYPARSVRPIPDLEIQFAFGQESDTNLTVGLLIERKQKKPALFWYIDVRPPFQRTDGVRSAAITPLSITGPPPRARSTL